MKTCANCGHENPDEAVRCDECGWAVPKVHWNARLGNVLKRVAGTAMILFVIFQFVSSAVIKAIGGGGEDGVYGVMFAFYSWRTFIVAMGLGAGLFWAGDYLKRTY
jgi:hypothetical protein